MARHDPMHRYIAFLRGINLGKRRVKMDQLRDLFQALNFVNVSTFLASGNVIFDAAEADAADLERRIEAHLHAALGYPVDTLLRTPAELAVVAAFRPFAAAEIEAPGHTLHIGFLRDVPAEAAARKLLSLRTEYDDFHVHGRELYWLCRGRFSDSLVGWPVVARTIATASTMRNRSTVQKLAAMHPAV
ncbi:MAG TPA: DUF1697 domain-containing protein [Gemmataceae bacterium]|nr:DUF1697 domain-containing protein [Gemmataceae bacterium]